MVIYYLKNLLFSTVSNINSQSSPQSKTIRRRVSSRGLTLYKISLACQYNLSHHDTTHVILLLGQCPLAGHRFLRSQLGLSLSIRSLSLSPFSWKGTAQPSPSIPTIVSTKALFYCCTDRWRCRSRLKCFREAMLDNRRLDRIPRKAKHTHCGYKRNSEQLLGIKNSVVFSKCKCKFFNNCLIEVSLGITKSRAKLQVILSKIYCMQVISLWKERRYRFA